MYSDKTGLAARAWDVWDPDTEIALAATFVIAKGGEVILRFIGADKTDRPVIEDLLTVLPKVEAAADKPKADSN